MLGSLIPYDYLNRDEEEGDRVVRIDRNQDGEPDEFYYYSTGYLEKIETNRDFAGGIDLVTQYENEEAVYTKMDENFNGTFDTFLAYKLGQPFQFQADLNEDGFIDHVGTYENGVLAEMSILVQSDHGDSYTVRIDYFQLGKVVKSDIDQDGDMRLDTREFYDFVGRVIRKEEL